MPNGTDCSNALQTEALCVPTQWFVFDCTADGRVGPWLREDVGNEIDYLHVRRPPGGASAAGAKRGWVEARPAAMGALLDAYRRRKAAGSSGRLVVWAVADLADPLGARWLAELPFDVANLMFWESGYVPGVLRVAVGGGDGDVRRYLSAVHRQYFGTVDFAKPYYGRHAPGDLYGNEFDSTLLCPDYAAAASLLGHLVALHLEETRFARAHLERHRAGGIMVVEEVMRRSLRWRKIDWLAVACYPYFRRLWDPGRGEDVLDVLDYRRCPQREQDPWAALKDRAREKNWDDRGVGPEAATFDPMEGEEPYRITPGDHRSRRALTAFLIRERLHDEALRQCEAARAEGGYAADLKWVKYEALARHALGEVPRALALLAEYRGRLQAEPDPPAEAWDEVGSVALMEGEFALAYEAAGRAVAKDKFLGHAYDTMVIAGREAGRPEYERAAALLAEANGVTVPIHVRERANEALRSAKIIKPGERGKGPEESKGSEGPRRSKRWWEFWK